MFFYATVPDANVVLGHRLAALKDETQLESDDLRGVRGIKWTIAQHLMDFAR